jgi:PKD repeat protein
MKQLFTILLIAAIAFGCNRSSNGGLTYGSGPSQYAKPVANFSINNGMTSNSVMEAKLLEFNNKSTNGISYSWDFGNGMTSTEKNPSTFFYPMHGDYTIKLTVTGADGQTVQYSQFYTVICARTDPNHAPFTSPLQ